MPPPRKPGCGEIVLGPVLNSVTRWKLARNQNQAVLTCGAGLQFPRLLLAPGFGWEPRAPTARSAGQAGDQPALPVSRLKPAAQVPPHVTDGGIS